MQAVSPLSGSGPQRAHFQGHGWLDLEQQEGETRENWLQRLRDSFNDLSPADAKTENLQSMSTASSRRHLDGDDIVGSSSARAGTDSTGAGRTNFGGADQDGVLDSS